MRAEACDRRGRGLERPRPVTERVVTVGVQRVDAHRDAGHARRHQRLDARVGEKRPVGADHHGGTAARREGGDRLQVVAQEGLAAGQNEQRRRIHGEDLAGDAQAFVRAQVECRALVRTRRDVAVGAFEVAAAREIPGDHVGHVIVARVWRRERDCLVV
jgi:hypothetical protein